MDATTPNSNFPHKAPVWMAAVLWLAAVYHLLWGTVALVLPNQMFEWAKMDPLNYPQVWQGLGMVIAMLGVGYAIAAANPYRHWGIVLVGFLAKLCGPVGMVIGVVQGAFTMEFAYQSIPNHLIWIVPFAFILHGAWRAGHPRAERMKAARGSATAETREAADSPERAGDELFAPSDDHGAPYKAAETAALAAATRHATLHRGHMLSALSLRELSDKTPTLVVFLRHLGCTFCRETLAKVAAERKAIESKGVAIVLVHMSPPNKAIRLFEKYGLDEPEPVWHTSDPARKLYQAFELPRGKFGQLFGLQEFTRGFNAGILKGHFVGWPQGDGRQLGGAFLYYRRRVMQAYRATRASDRSDVGAIASCPIDLESVPPPPVPLSRRATSTA